MNNLEKSILKTLAFFDIFNYPLTLTELWKWLYRSNGQVKLSAIKEALKTSQILKEKVSTIEGFYSLKDREFTCYLRKKNNKLAEGKFRKAIYLAKVFRYIPYVRMIAICNTLAYSNTKDDSDIDLFIIAKKNKMWLARFFTIMVVKMLRARPTEENTKDTFCLSFFIDEDHLNIKSAMLGNNDVYYPYWLGQLMPLYNPDNLYQKFLEDNKWYLEFLPNSYSNHFPKEVKQTFNSKLFSRVVEFVTSPPLLNKWLDDVYRRLQVSIIDSNIKSLVNIDSRVIVNEQMIKIYYNDNREFFSKKWKEIIYKLLHKYEKNSKHLV